MDKWMDLRILSFPDFENERQHHLFYSSMTPSMKLEVINNGEDSKLNIEWKPSETEIVTCDILCFNTSYWLFE